MCFDKNYLLLWRWWNFAYVPQPHGKTHTCTVRAPVFGRYQFFGTSEHYRKTHGNLLSGWMNYNCTACCWFPTSSNILILPSQFWQIRFESCWLHCSKCRILVLLRYVCIMCVHGYRLILGYMYVLCTWILSAVL